MVVSTGGHTVTRYNEELESLHKIIRRIAKLVRLQIRDAAKTLKDEDVETAREVIKRDKEINELDIQMDEELALVIARRQPVARDLRAIISAGKVVTDLERMGDLARDIARLTIHFYEGDHHTPNQHMLSDIYKMAKLVDVMVEKAVDAYDNRDMELASEVVHLKVELVEEFRSALRKLSTFIMEDSRSVGHMVDIVLTLGGLERIGSHALNIAQYMVYLVEGKDVRHVSTKKLLKRLESN